MRRMSTVVLPLPAPARMSSGPSAASAACRCWGFRSLRLISITACRAARKRVLNVSMVYFLISVICPETANGTTAGRSFHYTSFFLFC